MKEEWLMSGAVVPVDVETTAALVAEIKRLIDVVGGMALAQPEQEPTQWRDMVVVSLVREGIDKHRARELADHFAAQPESCQTCVEIHSLLDADESMIIKNARDGYPEGRTPREFSLPERVKALCKYAADWKRWCIEAQTPPTAQPEQVDCPRCGHVCSSREQEPVAWGVFEGNLHDMFFTQEEAQEMAQLKGSHAEVRPLYTTAAQPEQEPVAFYHPHKGFYWAKPTHISAPTVVDVPPVPLYVKWIAAQRTWVGLTDEDWDKVGDMPDTFDQGVAWAQARLKEKNT